jgi:hypothetical protein
VAWVDTTYLQNLIGSDQVTALGLSGARLTQYELMARGSVVSVLQFAGYTQFTSDTLDTSTPTAAVTAAWLQKVTAACLVQDAMALLPGIQLPPPVADSIGRALSELQAVYNKKLPVPNAKPSASGGIGGVKFSTGQPQVFNLRGSTF